MEDLSFSLLELEKNPKFLLEKNIQQVTISDEDFFSNKARFINLVKLIEKQVPDVHFTFYLSPSIIDKEIVENLSLIACTLQIDFLSDFLNEKRKFFSKKIRLLNDYGLVFGFNIDSVNFPTIKGFKNALDEAISDSAAGILSLGGYIIFFSIITLIPLELLTMPDKVKQVIICFLEITNGLSYRNSLPPYALLAFLQFGGICCIFQTIKFTSKTDLNIKNYLIHKIKLTVLTFIFFCLVSCFLF